MGGRRWDVFLSYSSRDRPAIEQIAHLLKQAGLEPFFDRWCLSAGGRWQQELAEGLRNSASCAVFIGPHDLGAWEHQELSFALDRAAKDSSFRVFPVLLKGLPASLVRVLVGSGEVARAKGFMGGMEVAALRDRIAC